LLETCREVKQVNTSESASSWLLTRIFMVTCAVSSIKYCVVYRCCWTGKIYSES